MTKRPGTSPEYRDLLKGKISPDEYIAKLKKEVEKHQERRTSAPHRARSAA